MRRRTAQQFGALRAEVRTLVKAPPKHAVSTAAGPTLRGILRRDIAELERELRKVHSLADREAIHEARIAAKRLRYLLEPFERELPGAPLLVDGLRSLQRLLGQIHDVHVFGDELRDALAMIGKDRGRRTGLDLLPWPAPNARKSPGAPPGARWGLVSLASRLRADGEDRFAGFQSYRSRGGTAALLAGLRRLAGYGRRTNRGGRI